MTKQSVSSLVCSAVVSVFMLNQALAESDLGAHEHGVAKLDIAVEAKALHIMFESPAANIVGFEHAPSNSEQQAAVAAAREQLEKPIQLFTLPQAANCVVAEVKADWVAESAEEHGSHDHDHDHEHDKDHDDEKAASHSEFHAQYTISCADTGALETLSVNLFTIYPSIEKIITQVVTPARQIGVELTAESNEIQFVD